METVLAVAIFGTVGITVLSGLQTASISKRVFHQDSQAELLVRNQLDSVLLESYQTPGNNYTPISAPTGYTVTAESVTHMSTSTDISRVRITVAQDGGTVKVYETLRTNR